jgi:hypothetical protein
MNATRSFVRAQTIVLALVIPPIHAHDYPPARSAPLVRASVFAQPSRSSTVETVQFHSALVGKLNTTRSVLYVPAIALFGSLQREHFAARFRRQNLV